MYPMMKWKNHRNLNGIKTDFRLSSDDKNEVCRVVHWTESQRDSPGIEPWNWGKVPVYQPLGLSVLSSCNCRCLEAANHLYCKVVMRSCGHEVMRSWGHEVMKVMKTSTEVKSVSDCKHFDRILNESVSIIYYYFLRKCVPICTLHPPSWPSWPHDLMTFMTSWPQNDRRTPPVFADHHSW